MDTAVVVREAGDGPALRTAVVARDVAEAMALRDWIQTTGTGRVLRYRITPGGRAALKKFVARAESEKAKTTGSGMEFAEAEAEFLPAGGEADGRRKAVRYSLAESPLVSLGRRRDRDGKPFLSEELVAAGERLREDFELSQIGTQVTQNWDRFLTGPVDSGRAHAAGPGPRRRRSGSGRPLARSGRGLGTWRCGAAATSKGSRRQSAAWAGRHGRARSSYGSRSSG